MRTIDDIENEMRDLYPKKELAYLDYLDNTGNNSGLRERLWKEFKQCQNQWNAFVGERKKLLNNS